MPGIPAATLLNRAVLALALDQWPAHVAPQDAPEHPNFSYCQDKQNRDREPATSMAGILVVTACAVQRAYTRCTAAISFVPRSPGNAWAYFHCG